MSLVTRHTRIHKPDGASEQECLQDCLPTTRFSDVPHTEILGSSVIGCALSDFVSIDSIDVQLDSSAVLPCGML